jgi:hypothetical protein
MQLNKLAGKKRSLVFEGVERTVAILKWTITSSLIEHFRQIGLSIIRSTIDRTARSHFHIVNAIYLGVRAFAERGLCRRCR